MNALAGEDPSAAGVVWDNSPCTDDSNWRTAARNVSHSYTQYNRTIGKGASSRAGSEVENTGAVMSSDKQLR